MTTSKRLADTKQTRAVPETVSKKGDNYPVGPILLGFFVFVVVGSSLFQIIRTATSVGMATKQLSCDDLMLMASSSDVFFPRVGPYVEMQDYLYRSTFTYVVKNSVTISPPYPCVF